MNIKFIHTIYTQKKSKHYATHDKQTGLLEITVQYNCELHPINV